MRRKYSEAYIDKLLRGHKYGDLVDLSRAICSSGTWSPHEPECGLPTVAFVFVELLQWLAQSIRSGVWTYYEATSKQRQEEMHRALLQFAPGGFGEKYAQGMRDWHDPILIHVVDEWIEANDSRANQWLSELARNHRDALIAMTA